MLVRTPVHNSKCSNGRGQPLQPEESKCSLTSATRKLDLILRIDRELRRYIDLCFATRADEFLATRVLSAWSARVGDSAVDLAGDSPVTLSAYTMAVCGFVQPDTS
jgi:hypothetical protein